MFSNPFVSKSTSLVSSSFSRTLGSASYAQLCRRLDISVTRPPASDRFYFEYWYLRSGEVLCCAGQSLDTIYVVSSGTLKTEMLVAERRTICRFLMAGDIIGVDAIYSGCFDCNVVSVADSVVIAMPYEIFMTLCVESGEFETAILKYMSKILADRIKHRTLAATNAQTRVANFLIWLGERLNELGLSSQVLTLPMSRAELGSHLGLTHETVSRVLGRLRDLRCICINGHHVEIKDYQALREIAKPSGSLRCSRAEGREATASVCNVSENPKHFKQTYSLR